MAHFQASAGLPWQNHQEAALWAEVGCQGEAGEGVCRFLAEVEGQEAAFLAAVWAGEWHRELAREQKGSLACTITAILMGMKIATDSKVQEFLDWSI